MNSTVKRKFNALLQGIGNRPATERSSTERDSSILADPALSPAAAPSPRAMASDSSFDLHKKRRVGGPTSTPTKYGSLQGSPASIRSVPPTTTTISNITLRRWTPGSGSPAPDRHEGVPPPPKYCPGDREQLLKRLGTFQELTDWTPKPDRVSEVEWAKRGWVCQGKERVRCTLCGQELVVKVNRKEVDGKEIAVLIASEIAESVVDKYAELIVEGHVEDCLWRKKGCDDSLLRLPLPNPKLALQGLRQRYDELCERGPFLPYESSLRLPPTLDLDTVISHLPPTFFSDPPPPPPPNKANPLPSTTTTTTSTPTPTSTVAPPPPPPPINRPALALALFGWQSLHHPTLHTPVPNSASCHTCLRRLGLWMFKPRAPAAAADADSESGLDALVPAPMDYLDPVREHRFFCPWKNPAAQRNPGVLKTATTAGVGKGGGGDLAAWEVLVTGLRNEAFIRDKVAASAPGGGRKGTVRGMGGGGGGIGTAGKGGGVLGHARSKSSVPAPGQGGSDGRPKTPERPITVDGGARVLVGGDGGIAERVGAEEEGEVVVDDEEARKKKDADMMSRLRRVKSLFNTKAGSKLRKLGGSSRPGTSHSTAGGE